MQRGSSSGVEHNLAKVGVAGSNPVSRSKTAIPFGLFLGLGDVLPLLPACLWKAGSKPLFSLATPAANKKT